MASFDLAQFIQAPSLGQIDSCRKDNLLAIIAHFKVSVPKQSLKALLVKTLVDLGVLVMPETTESNMQAIGVSARVAREKLPMQS